MAMAMSEVRESSNPESSHLSASPQWFGSIEILYIDYSRTYIEAYIHEREMVQWLIDARHFKDCSCIFSRHEFVRWKSSKFTSFSILRLFFNPPASTSPSRPWASVHSSLKSRSKRRLARSPPIHINPPILCPICGISCPVKCCELVTRCGNWMFSCLALLVWIDCKPKSILKGSCRPRCPVWCFPSFWCFPTETLTFTAHVRSLNKSFEMPTAEMEKFRAVSCQNGIPWAVHVADPDRRIRRCPGVEHALSNLYTRSLQLRKVWLTWKDLSYRYDKFCCKLRTREDIRQDLKVVYAVLSIPGWFDRFWCSNLVRPGKSQNTFGSLLEKSIGMSQVGPLQA